MPITCEIFVTENTTQILDSQTKLATLAAPFPLRASLRYIKLASKPALRPTDGEIFPLERCSVLSVIATNTFGVRPSPTQALRLIR
jgi:hypothetical protein